MNQEKLSNQRHTLAHILASVILKKYPETKLTLGPAIDNGFYYDIDFLKEKPETEKDFLYITEKMKEIIRAGGNFSHKEVTETEAKEYFQNNIYKLELIDKIINKEEKINFYTINNFTDLCRGGHVEDLTEIDPESFKITHTAGAYWGGDEKNKMLTRIYGLAFQSKED